MKKKQYKLLPLQSPAEQGLALEWWEGLSEEERNHFCYKHHVNVFQEVPKKIIERIWAREYKPEEIDGEPSVEEVLAPKQTYYLDSDKLEAFLRSFSTEDLEGVVNLINKIKSNE